MRLTVIGAALLGLAVGAAWSDTPTTDGGGEKSPPATASSPTGVETGGRGRSLAGGPCGYGGHRPAPLPRGGGKSSGPKAVGDKAEANAAAPGRGHRSGAEGVASVTGSASGGGRPAPDSNATLRGPQFQRVVLIAYPVRSEHAAMQLLQALLRVPGIKDATVQPLKGQPGYAEVTLLVTGEEVLARLNAAVQPLGVRLGRVFPSSSR